MLGIVVEVERAMGRASKAQVLDRRCFEHAFLNSANPSPLPDYGLLADSTPQELKLNLTQRYVFKSAIPFKSKGGEKTMNSLVTLKLNPEGKIKYHDEEWNHEDNKDADDGFMGKVQEARKKVDAKLVEATVSSDPSKVNS